MFIYGDQVSIDRRSERERERERERETERESGGEGEGERGGERGGESVNHQSADATPIRSTSRINTRLYNLSLSLNIRSEMSIY